MQVKDTTNEQTAIRKLGILRLLLRRADVDEYTRGMEFDLTGNFSSLEHVIQHNEMIILLSIINHEFGNLLQFTVGTDCVTSIKSLIDHKGDVSLHEYIRTVNPNDDEQLKALCEFTFGLPVLYNPSCSHFFKEIADKLDIKHTSIRTGRNNGFETRVYNKWIQLMS